MAVGTDFGYRLIRAHGTEFINQYIQYLGLSWRKKLQMPRIYIQYFTPPLLNRMANAPIGHTRVANFIKTKWKSITESRAVVAASHVYHTVTGPFASLFERFQVIDPKPIFNEKLQKQVDEIIEGVRNLRRHNAPLQNVLLEGPPGVGKTMIAQQLYNRLGMRCIRFSGPQLLAIANEINVKDAIEQINKIFAYAEGGVPCVIFIDELDALFPKRTSRLNIYQIQVINALLDRTGENSKNFMIIGATNRRESLDWAFLRRMDHIVRLTPPNKASRIKIIKQYVEIEFRRQRELEDFFTDEIYEHIADKTKGVSGSDLQKIVKNLKVQKAANQENRLTLKAVDRLLDLFMERFGPRDLPKEAPPPPPEKSLLRKVADFVISFFAAILDSPRRVKDSVSSLFSRVFYNEQAEEKPTKSDGRTPPTWLQ
jgi:Holliday junction resolvasome RuvABC ATP-dependent DNA helicase subunit